MLILVFVTLIFGRLAWQAYQLAGLTIPFNSESDLLPRLTAEIQKLGFPAPKSVKNQLHFQIQFPPRSVVVTSSASSVDVHGPAAVQKALLNSFPQAVPKPVAKERRQGMVMAFGMWAWIVGVMFAASYFISKI